MTARRILLPALAAVALLAAPARAQTPTPATDPTLLERADSARTKGDPAAPVTIIEISDFQCPYCREWTTNTWPRLDSAYVRTGKVRMIFVNYPLPSHGQAFLAAEAAMCAGAQGRFWEMHDRIFAAQREWSGQPDAAARMAALAASAGVDAGAFRACTEADAVASLIIGDAMDVAGAGIRGTPTFLLNGQQVLQGAVSFEEMATVIEQLLTAPPPPAVEPPPPVGP